MELIPDIRIPKGKLKGVFKDAEKGLRSSTWFMFLTIPRDSESEAR